jgi:hypothetical protein
VQSPLYHAGGFGWDELLILVVAVAAVPVLSYLIDRRGRPDRPRQPDQSAALERPATRDTGPPEVCDAPRTEDKEKGDDASARDG